VEQVTYEELLEVAKKACIAEESIHSMPFPISEEAVASAIMAADQLGRQYKLSKEL
jgi:glycerol dehydrogenase